MDNGLFGAAKARIPIANNSPRVISGKTRRTARFASQAHLRIGQFHIALRFQRPKNEVIAGTPKEKQGEFEGLEAAFCS